MSMPSGVRCRERRGPGRQAGGVPGTSRVYAVMALAVASMYQYINTVSDQMSNRPDRAASPERDSAPSDMAGRSALPSMLETGQPRGNSAVPLVWGNVPPRNPNFTGRRDLLARLDEHVEMGSTTAILPAALH